MRLQILYEPVLHVENEYQYGDGARVMFVKESEPDG